MSVTTIDGVSLLRYTRVWLSQGGMECTMTSMVHIRVDDAVKDQATEALAAMGLTLSEGVRVFLRRVASDQAMPFPLKVPNAVTRAAMEEARAINKGRRARYATAEELFDGLQAADAQQKTRKRSPMV